MARAIGLRGHVGVAGSSGALGQVAEVALERDGARSAPRRVLEARPQGRVWAVLLEGVAGRDAAEALAGQVVLARRDELGEAGEGAHLWVDLEGLPVVTASGEALGRVTGLLETGAVDVLEVRGDRGEALIPLAPYVNVDRQAGRIVVDPPDGLLELGRTGTDEKGGPERGE